MKGTGHRAQGAGPKGDEEKGRGGDRSKAKIPCQRNEEAERQRDGETERLGDGETKGPEGGKKGGLVVTRLKMRTGVVLAAVFVILYFVMWEVLSRFTNSPVPVWDSFITSLSIVATWMLARKIYEHWYLWIIVNSVSAILFLSRGLYPTMILYIIYCIMSFSGLRAWKRT
jgi:hypothetical protein